MSGNPKGSPWRSTPRAKRKSPIVTVTLPPELAAKLARLGDSPSAVIQHLIREAPEPTTSLDESVWRHADGSAHSETGPLGCFLCALERRRAGAK